jgi:hypothetical protein
MLREKAAQMRDEGKQAAAGTGCEEEMRKAA